MRQIAKTRCSYCHFRGLDVWSCIIGCHHNLYSLLHCKYLICEHEIMYDSGAYVSCLPPHPVHSSTTWVGSRWVLKSRHVLVRASAHVAMPEVEALFHLAFMDIRRTSLHTYTHSSCSVYIRFRYQCGYKHQCRVLLSSDDPHSCLLFLIKPNKFININ